MDYLRFVACCILWGSNFIMMERAGHALSPIAIGTLRLAGGAAVLAGVALALGRARHVERRHWKHILLASLVGNAWPFLIMPLLISRGHGHSYFGALVSLVPLMTIGFSIPMLRHWPTTRQIAGVVGGLLFIGCILFDGNARGMPSSLLILALTVPMAYAFANTYVKWKLAHLPALPLTAAFLGGGAMFLLPVWIVAGLAPSTALSGPIVPRDWTLAFVALAYLSVVGTGFAAAMFIQMVQHRGPLFASMVTYIVPCLALLWGTYDQEQISALQCLGIAGILAMVALVQFAPSTENDTGLGLTAPQSPTDRQPADPAD